MKLSVIVPAYNLERYIGECLRSVLDQHADFDYEVLVCDDASTDNTREEIEALCQEFSHLKAIFKTQNAGLAENMKTLLGEAGGKYIQLSYEYYSR